MICAIHQGEQALEIREAARLGTSGGEDLLANLGLWGQCPPPAVPKKCRVGGMLDFDRPPVSFLAGNQPWEVYRYRPATHSGMAILSSKIFPPIDSDPISPILVSYVVKSPLAALMQVLVLRCQGSTGYRFVVDI